MQIKEHNFYQRQIEVHSGVMPILQRGGLSSSGVFMHKSMCCAVKTSILYPRGKATTATPLRSTTTSDQLAATVGWQKTLDAVTQTSPGYLAAVGAVRTPVPCLSP